MYSNDMYRRDETQLMMLITTNLFTQENVTNTKAFSEKKTFVFIQISLQFVARGAIANTSAMLSD